MILVVLPALVIALASVLGFFGAWWWVFDLLASVRPVYAAVLLVAGIVLVVGRWRRTGAVVLTAGLVNLAVVIPLYIAPTDRANPTGANLRVMSFNVHAQNDDYVAVIDYIRRIDPDVVFLHESTRLWEEALTEADLDYRLVSGRNPGLIFGSVALVPEDAVAQSRGFGEAEPRALEVVVPTAAGEVAIMGIHPLSPSTERRAALRDAQLDFVAEWAASRSERTVVVGDYNTTTWSHSFRDLLRRGGLHNSQRGYGIQATFPATSNPVVRVPIDHLLYSDGLSVIDRRLGPPLGSDHFPLVVDLALSR